MSHTHPHTIICLNKSKMRHNDLKTIRSSDHICDNHLMNDIRNRYVYKINLNKLNKLPHNFKTSISFGLKSDNLKRKQQWQSSQH